MQRVSWVMAVWVVATVAGPACSRGNPDFDAVAISTSSVGDGGATTRPTSGAGEVSADGSGDDVSTTATQATVTADGTSQSTTTGVDPPEPFVLDPCCSPQNAPGCADADVEACTCALDPYCCSTQWDGQCVFEAQFDCGLGCPGDCCALGDEPGCNDETLANQVCEVMPSCCGDSWSAGCPDAAAALGQCASANDCCLASDAFAPYCENADVVICTCTLDDFCCDVEWDAACTQTAIGQCGLAGCAATPGPCCGTSSAPECDDQGVASAVCMSDPSCCESAWSDQCLEAAIGLGACGGGQSCCEEAATPGCASEELMICVCAEEGDSFCCSSAWDVFCVAQAEVLCGAKCPG